MVSMVDQMVDQNATCLTRRRGVHYYCTRRLKLGSGVPEMGSMPILGS